MDPRRRRRLAAAVAALAVVVAACGSSTVSPSSSPTTPPSVAPSTAPTPTPDPATVYADIEAQVQQIRGLKATKPVQPKLLDDATLKANLSRSFDKDNPPKVVAATERMYELMRLLPSGVSLRDVYLKLLGSQVAGYYDSKTKELYVVSRSGGLGPTERVTFAHEFDHALQDQSFGLDKLQLGAVGQSDRGMAHLSVPEGDATLLMSYWAQAHLTQAELFQLVAEANNPDQARILAEMPDILKEDLLFPYTAGVSMVIGIQTKGGWPAVDALYAKPPATTEQILHTDKYAAGEPPIAVTFPKDLDKRLGSGWSVDLEDTFGEFQLGVWLRSAGKVPPATASTAVMGWGGDRVAVASNGDRAGVVLDTRWDSPAEAREFATAAQAALDAFGRDFSLIALDGSDRVTLFFGDDATMTALAGALGLAG